MTQMFEHTDVGSAFDLDSAPVCEATTDGLPCPNTAAWALTFGHTRCRNRGLACTPHKETITAQALYCQTHDNAPVTIERIDPL